MYYFLHEDKKQQMQELRRDDVTFSQRVNSEDGVALVVVTKEEKRDDDAFDHRTAVALRRDDGKWRVVRFPEFFPIDAFELLTEKEGLAP